MNEELRAMTLSLAVEFHKGDNLVRQASDLIDIAKAFEKHIVGSGFETPPPGVIFGGGSH
jgi:hypothetical protein